MDQVTAATLALQKRIFEGALLPGTRLRQKALADEFETSETPIREAFRRLEALGLVRLDPRRGVRVAPIDKDEVETSLLVRSRLEPLSLELASKPFNSAHLKELATNCRSASDPKEVFLANEAFHRELTSHTDQRFLVDTLEKARLISGRAMLLWMELLPALRGFDDDHLLIISHLESGDVSAAAERLQSHILRTLEQVRALKL